MYELSGNYFYGQYHLPPITGPRGVEVFLEKHSPADISKILWKCPVDYRHIEDIVHSSIEGFQIWRKTSIEERINALIRYQEVLLSKKNEIAKAISWEVGKPYWEALTEADALIAKISVTIEHSLPLIAQKKILEIAPQTNGVINYKPIGPCLIIGPFNFPCHLPNGQIVSCLLAGNSIVFKPSEKTCYSSQLMFDCLIEANFPKGVVNLAQGDGEMASRLVRSRAIKGVFFTGSKDIGLKILSYTYEDLSKLVALELGGKNPCIIHEDADLDHALGETIKGAFLSTGQRCTSTALTFVHRSKVQEYVSRYHDLAKRLIVDHPIEHKELPFMGPLIDKRAHDTYLLFVGMAKREGLEEIMRGKTLERKSKGYYVSPSIHFSETYKEDSHFILNEIFGPNNTIIPYDDFEEAIAMANKSEYGLAASIFTQQNSLYELALRDIEAGLVNLNRSTVGASSRLPFGGVKNSGNFHPMALTTINSCVHTQSGLEIYDVAEDSIQTIKGLGPEIS